MFKSLFYNFQSRNIKKYKSIVTQINQASQKLNSLSNNELQYQTVLLQQKCQNCESLDDLIIQAFAVVKEAINRVLGLTLFDVQLIGGIILHQGKIAEMKTGEGKTIVATLPAYLNALSKKGVHIVTVNDYLAKRDAEWIGQVYKFLGLSVGLIQPNMTYKERYLNYLCDITYVTNSQLGFDYLKDNMAITKEEIVQRPFNFAIVDEVDSILIDESRTPLIISGPSESPTEKYITSATLSYKLKIDRDYEVDEKNKNVTLTEQGTIICENLLGIHDLYSLKDPWAPYIFNSLKAKELFIKNIHYILQDNTVFIIDEFTGRVLQGRRWSNGLHQAIEAKENVPIQYENKTLASITYQSLFLLYPKLSGMTGTAKTEEIELNKIYNLEVVVVPTNKPCIRHDFPDLVYQSEYSKWKAVANECLDMYTIGRPTLVGTSSIDKSEILARILDQYSIPYSLLNAKPEYIKKEAEIIAQAGKKFSITIATNMAGRGTDIVLGGNLNKIIISCIVYYLSIRLNFSIKDFKVLLPTNIALHIKKDIDRAFEQSKQQNQSLITQDVTSILALEAYVIKAVKKDIYFNKTTQFLENLYDSAWRKYEESFEFEKKEIIQLGGLHVIGTERHESRRIDNQLRGRSGRQGDPGSSRFFLSLEDNLLRIFGADTLNNVMRVLNLGEDTPIESSIITRSLDSAQKKVESYFYNIRKQLFDYDEVLSDQRQAIYAERNRILYSNNCRDSIMEYTEITVYDLVNKYIKLQTSMSNSFLLSKSVKALLNISNNLDVIDLHSLDQENICEILCQEAHTSYDLQEAYFNKIEVGLIRELEKYYLLQQIDNGWQKHLENMTALQDSIGLKGYAQQDPLTEYKRSAFNLFIRMISYVRQTVTFLMFNTK